MRRGAQNDQMWWPTVQDCEDAVELINKATGATLRCGVPGWETCVQGCTLEAAEALNKLLHIKGV